MAFKKVTEYNEERFGKFFLLRNDMEFADVVFLYRDIEDVLMADTHYIKSSEYSGYAHCNGKTCPACAKGIRVQAKIFVPLYNITAGEIQFWDRSIRFENQIQQEVFSKYPNPSEFVFRIQRHGPAGDINTSYSITAVGRNTFKSYTDILSENNLSFPNSYSEVCKELTDSAMFSMINTDASAPSATAPAYSYDATPRQAYGQPPVVSPISTNPDIPQLADIDDDLDTADIDLDEPVDF